ncbi:carbohydrate ABC transporter permease [Hoeflea poritis]|uniref:Sugar ABC transporter permease n=1 Tax=Hoeflea poritis TaxID=2993659 RepID=A0ABT4VT71_9HYPH|nr:sugar ABC transporter permease [Hoeflea poritis]MDA4847809.1 sugar ABC transporter permease [Hoeflea poritis]
MIGDRSWKIVSLGPLATLLVVFTMLPVLQILWMVFHELEWSDGQAVTTFGGLGNIRKFIADLFYWPGLWNTIYFAFFAVVIQFIIGLSLALAVAGMKGWVRVVAIFVMLLPVVTPPIVIGAVWNLLYNADFGAINLFLSSVGLPKQNWISSPDTALWAVIIVDVWHWTPFVFLLLLTGREGLPEEVYEAAELDTQNRWQILRHITLPLMMPVIIATLILRMILSFKVFDEIYLLTSGGPGTATEVVSLSIQRAYFGQDDVGLGSVMSLFTLSVVAGLALATLWFQRYMIGRSGT